MVQQVWGESRSCGVSPSKSTTLSIPHTRMASNTVKVGGAAAAMVISGIVI